MKNILVSFSCLLVICSVASAQESEKYRCRDEGRSVLRTTITARDEIVVWRKSHPGVALEVIGLPVEKGVTNAASIRAMRINQGLAYWLGRMRFPDVRLTGYDPRYLASVDPETVKPVIKDHWIAQTYSRNAKNWRPDNRFAEKLDLAERARQRPDPSVRRRQDGRLDGYARDPQGLGCDDARGAQDHPDRRHPPGPGRLHRLARAHRADAGGHLELY